MTSQKQTQPALKPRRALRITLRRFHNDEEGAAYTLSYVMVIPVYALLICLIIETVFMLTSKLGTVYAAYAAARTASVWSSATTWEKTMKKAQRAAFKTMTPFASGTQPLLSNIPTDPDADTVVDALAYYGAYRLYGKNPVSMKYVLSKYGYAARHLKVEIEGPPDTADADITAKVTYEFPFNVPGIGRIIGHRGIDGRFYYSISSTVTIPNEGPRENRKTIGIGYGTLE